MTLDRYFAYQLDFMNPRYYDVAATFELIPAWLRFLESRGLVDADHSQRTLAELSQLHTVLLPFFESHREDPRLAEILQQWNTTAEQTGCRGKISA